jgi:hypothetical protein
MPPNMQSFKLTDASSNQDDEHKSNYVFVKALQETSVQVDCPLNGLETVEMKKGEERFLPYLSVRDHLQSGSKALLLL